MGCYICGAPATSVEHVPAKSFFPKNKRVNLYTVDSCKDHNEETSKDDEYVRNIIAMAIGGNDTGMKHFLDVCMRSFQNSIGLLKATTNINTTVFVSEKGGEAQPTYAFQIDRQRIDKVLRKIAYALYYHTYKSSWNRELAIGTEYLIKDSMSTDEYGLLIQKAKKIVPELPFIGNNQDVFKHCFLATESDDTNEQILVMKFYDGFEIWAFAQSNTTGPKL